MFRSNVGEVPRRQRQPSPLSDDVFLPSEHDKVRATSSAATKPTKSHPSSRHYTPEEAAELVKKLLRHVRDEKCPSDGLHFDYDALQAEEEARRVHKKRPDSRTVDLVFSRGTHHDENHNPTR